jgi:hypothetical protein
MAGKTAAKKGSGKGKKSTAITRKKGQSKKGAIAVMREAPKHPSKVLCGNATNMMRRTASTKQPSAVPVANADDVSMTDTSTFDEESLESFQSSTQQRSKRNHALQPLVTTRRLLLSTSNKAQLRLADEEGSLPNQSSQSSDDSGSEHGKLPFAMTATRPPVAVPTNIVVTVNPTANGEINSTGTVLDTAGLCPKAVAMIQDLTKRCASLAKTVADLEVVNNRINQDKRILEATETDNLIPMALNEAQKAQVGKYANNVIYPEIKFINELTFSKHPSIMNKCMENMGVHGNTQKLSIWTACKARIKDALAHKRHYDMDKLRTKVMGKFTTHRYAYR